MNARWLLAFLLPLSIAAQTIDPGGVVNAADFRRTLTAHSIAAVFGGNLAIQECAAMTLPLPRLLCGTQVRVSDPQGNFVYAPLFYVSPRQINFQVPISLGSLSLCVGTACQSILVDLQAPAIFELLHEGVVKPVILHSGDFSLVTEQSPAANGEVLVMFATGMGLSYRTLAFPPDGEAAPLDPLTEFGGARLIRIAGAIAPVSYAGLAPGFVALAQFNFTVAEEFIASRKFSGPVPLWIEEVGKSKQVTLHVK